jgi:hypothetical protein
VATQATKVMQLVNDVLVMNTISVEIKEVVIQIVGAFTGVIQLQVSNDGVTYTAIAVQNLNTLAAAATDMTVPGVYRAQISAARSIQAKATTLSAGTPTVTLQSGTV